MTEFTFLDLVAFIAIGTTTYSVVALLKKIFRLGASEEAGAFMKFVYRTSRRPWFRGFVLTPIPPVLGGLLSLMLPEVVWTSSSLIDVLLGIGAGSNSTTLYNIAKKRVASITEKNEPDHN